MQAFRLVNAAGQRVSGKQSIIEIEQERENRAEYDEVLTFVDLLGPKASLKSLKETYDKVRTTTT